MTVALVLGLVVIVAIVIGAALMFPQRVSSESHGVHPHEDSVDSETESYRDHNPGGGMGGL